MGTRFPLAFLTVAAASVGIAHDVAKHPSTTALAHIADVAADPAFTIDTTADRHPIPPDIYGMNFADPALMRELGMTVRRWGGNATTRYNYLDDTSNHGSDWFFETLPEDNADRARLPAGSSAERFIAEGLAIGTDTVLTVPLIGWTAKAGGRSCSFSVAKYGPQGKTDQWMPDCGNGLRRDGTPVTGNDPTDANTAIDPAFVKRWVTHLVDTFGDASQGGVRYYNLDNEPMLWHETHRDVFPRGLDYDGLRDRTLAYAAAVKDADPSAKTLGPAEWGWTGYFWSARDTEGGGDWWNHPADRLAHGDVPLAAWYLAQLRDAERVTGHRLLDYFDLHYYPQADGVSLSPAGDAATQARRLRSTRSLWDPTYKDESWIDEPVRLIPRMRDWVAANYPGTKLAIGEYNWGALDDINGALAQADVLGIFGREGVDLATLWDPMKSDEPGAFAFRMFRNYDGAGGRFGETAVRVTGGEATRDVAVYAAERAIDGALTVVAVNKTGDAVDRLACLVGFAPGPDVRVFRYDAATKASIWQERDAHPVYDLCGPNEDTAALRLELPPMSIMVIEAEPATQPTPSPPIPTTSPSSPPPTSTDRPTSIPTAAAPTTILVQRRIYLPYGQR
ncbi:MAG: glycoside hydrolase family 44 protein [Ardenticatenales bacterium]